MANHDYVNFMLKNVADDFNADRVVVATIHSYSYVDYEAYNKVFSVIFEHCAEDTKSVKGIVKNIPISILEIELEHYSDDFLVVNLDSSLPDKCFNHLKNINSKCIVNCLIRFNKLIVGVLSIQYTRAYRYKSTDELSSQQKQYLLEICNYLSSVI